MSNSWKERSTPIVTLVGLVLILAFTQVAQRSNYALARISGRANPCETQSDCRSRPFIDLAFIIDRSGSMDPAKRGQTFNMQIEGVLRSLSDPTVIPRDGSVAISVFTFAEQATLQFKLTEIRSQDDAERAALEIAAFKCVCGAANSCPAGRTNFGAAIRDAYRHLLQADEGRGVNDQRKQARQVLLLSTDGECTDTDLNRDCEKDAIDEVDTARRNAAKSGTTFEMDTILVGVDPIDVDDIKKRVKGIAFPQPADDLPGRTLLVRSGDCNSPRQCALPNCDPKECRFLGDCADQANQFAERVRSVLRSDIRPIQLEVRIGADTPADETLQTITDKETLSLREAILLANDNGGNATITFDGSVKTIFAKAPLPALTQPEITIDGGKRKQEDLLTIDGSMVNPQRSEQHDDGLLIRSNRITVARIGVVNFPGAGIAIAPLSRCDITGQNVISNNHLENNTKAGILVLDSPCDKSGNNLRNTLSGNTIQGKSIPIDLGGDGIACNDAGDGDDGPNTLLNYPSRFTVESQGNAVTATGIIDSPLAGGPFKIEVFAITRIKSSSGDAQRLTPLVTSEETVEKGEFTIRIKDPPVFPIDDYSATVTDGAGNTSEMRPISVAVLDRSTISFEETEARAKARDKNVPYVAFVVTNPGCDPTNIKFTSPPKRTGTDVDDHRIVDPDDSALFPVVRAQPDGSKGFPSRNSVIGQVVSIPPNGASRSFYVMFKPEIPPVITRAIEPASNPKELRASNVLPNFVESELTIEQQSGPDLKLRVTGSVATDVRLINRQAGRNPPTVCLARSVDKFVITFSVYDSNLDVNSATYRFCCDRNGQQIPPITVTSKLSEAIRSRELVKGQSFTVVQDIDIKRARPKDFDKVVKVSVTVSDGKDSGPLESSSEGCPLSTQENTIAESDVLVLPAVRLPTWSRRRHMHTPKRADRAGKQRT